MLSSMWTQARDGLQEGWGTRLGSPPATHGGVFRRQPCEGTVRKKERGLSAVRHESALRSSFLLELPVEVAKLGISQK